MTAQEYHPIIVSPNKTVPLNFKYILFNDPEKIIYLKRGFSTHHRELIYRVSKVRFFIWTHSFIQSFINFNVYKKLYISIRRVPYLQTKLDINKKKKYNIFMLHQGNAL